MTPKEWEEIKKWNQMPKMCRVINDPPHPKAPTRPINIGSKARKRREYQERLAKRKARRAA